MTTIDLTRMIKDAVGRRSPVLVVAEHGVGAVTASMEALGPGAKRVQCDVMEPTLPGIGGGLQGHVAGAASVVLDSVDRVQNKEVLNDIRHFLTTASCPVVVVVHDEAACEPNILALCARVGVKATWRQILKQDLARHEDLHKQARVAAKRYRFYYNIPCLEGEESLSSEDVQVFLEELRNLSKP